MSLVNIDCSAGMRWEGLGNGGWKISGLSSVLGVGRDDVAMLSLRIPVKRDLNYSSDFSRLRTKSR